MLKSYDELRKVDVRKYCDHQNAKDDRGNAIRLDDPCASVYRED